MKVNQQKLSEENRLLTRYLLLGYSRKRIAKEMSFSISSIANKLNNLFAMYSAKNKYDFLFKIVFDLIKEKNKIIRTNEEYINKLTLEVDTLKEFIVKIYNSDKEKDKLNFYSSKIKAYLEI